MACSGQEFVVTTESLKFEEEEPTCFDLQGAQFSDTVEIGYSTLRSLGTVTYLKWKPKFETHIRLHVYWSPKFQTHKRCLTHRIMELGRS
jgi:hypothetical protein